MADPVALAIEQKKAHDATAELLGALAERLGVDLAPVPENLFSREKGALEFAEWTRDGLALIDQASDAQGFALEETIKERDTLETELAELRKQTPAPTPAPAPAPPAETPAPASSKPATKRK